MKSTLQFGLIAGVITVIPTAIIMFSGSTILFENSWLSLAMGLLIPLGFMIVGGLRERKAQGGFMAYGQALKVTYVIYAVSALVGILFAVLFHNVIDPGYMERHREVIVQVTEDNFRRGMEWVGANEAQIMEALDQQSEAMDKSLEDQMNVYKTSKGIVLSTLMLLFFGIIMALIAALFVRRNPKLESA
jgi:hypothetical protein